jgi:Lrp/AsnC family leucine-responsive transcriptional regulator
MFIMTGRLPDETDWLILGALQDDARTPVSEIARAIGIPEDDAAARVARLEADGVITGYRAEVDPRKAGYSLSAIISVSTDGASHDQIINDALACNPEVTACWSVTGASDFLVEAHAPSLEFLEELLNDLARHGKLTTSIVLPRYGKRRKIHPPRESMTD